MSSLNNGYSNNQAGDFGNFHWKISNPNVTNNIPQMKSAGFQAPFIAGGNQTAYYLGGRANNNTQPEPARREYSAYKIIQEFRR